MSERPWQLPHAVCDGVDQQPPTVVGHGSQQQVPADALMLVLTNLAAVPCTCITSSVHDHTDGNADVEHVCVRSRLPLCLLFANGPCVAVLMQSPS